MRNVNARRLLWPKCRSESTRTRLDTRGQALHDASAVAGTARAGSVARVFDSLDARRVSLIALAALCTLLTVVDLYRTSAYVLFPADILLFSEGEFVGDILKLRVGHPIYTAEQNNEGNNYPPGAQALTYAIASIGGASSSIPLYRFIQVAFTLATALVAVRCWFRLTRLQSPDQRLPDLPAWLIFVAAFTFLVATNHLTNPYVHYLHPDALAQLVSLLAYMLLIDYAHTRNVRLLLLMAVLPALGFLVKQNAAIWAAFFCAYLALWDYPRSLRRLTVFAGATLGGLALVLGTCLVLWGAPFIYWVFTVLAVEPLMPTLSVTHFILALPYFTIGLWGGLALLRGCQLRQGSQFRQLLGLWIIWLLLFALEVYTSGLYGRRNHLGPGSLLAAIWFAAALVRLWVPITPGEKCTMRPWSWRYVARCLFVLMLLVYNIDITRVVPLRPDMQDAYRYVRDIEAEFAGQPPDRVLLDVGTWVYLGASVVAKDRAVAIGDRGYSGIGDFSHMLHRLEGKYYTRILVRNLHSPAFWYDFGGWGRSSGIRAALLANYEEIRTISRVAEDSVAPSYLFGEVSVLAPRLADGS